MTWIRTAPGTDVRPLAAVLLLAGLLSVVPPSAAAPAPPLPAIPVGTFNVTDYGAVGDGTTDNTTAIQRTINAARSAGGGTVEIPAPASSYESGPLSLYSNINLQIDNAATLQALPFDIYPGSRTAPPHFITVSTASTKLEI